MWRKFILCNADMPWLQYVLTGEPGLLEHATHQMKRIASDSQRSTQERFYIKGLKSTVEGPEGPQELSYVQSVLMPIKQWADKQLQDYHQHFAEVVPNIAKLKEAGNVDMKYLE